MRPTLSVACALLLAGSVFAASDAADEEGSEQERSDSSDNSDKPKLDRDGDGRVSRDEFTAVDPIFDYLDQDQDKIVRRSDIPEDEPEQVRFRLERWFERADRDQDGEITVAESKAGRSKQFDAYDNDGDGYLTPRDRSHRP